MRSDTIARHPSADRAAGSAALAGRCTAAHVRLWSVSAAGLATDLYSKAWAFRSLGADEQRAVIPGVLTFRRSLNSGALFGMGAGRGPLFILASLVALGFVVYLFFNSAARQRGLHVALGLILAGALGNLHDRVRVVADVLHLQSPGGTAIGIIVPGPDPESVYLGSYPDGADPRPYVTRAIAQRGRVGVVRDFIKLEPTLLGRPLWPWIFNVADACLVAGVGILILDFLRQHFRLRRAAPGDAAA